MQKEILVTTQFRDLYQLIAGLDEIYLSRQESGESYYQEILVWSPEKRSQIFDSYEKLEVFERYVWDLRLKVTLAAAQDSRLRKWAQKIGWKVLWDLPTENLQEAYEQDIKLKV